MFTGTELLAIVLAELEDTPTDADMVRHINSCLVEHYKQFRKTDTQEITATDTGYVDRMAGHLDILRIEGYKGDIVLSEDRTQIKFPEPGKYTVVSLVIPDFITTVSDAIDVNDIFKIGIARYAGAMFYLMDNDQVDAGKMLKAEADRLIINAGYALSGMDKRSGMRFKHTRSAVNYHGQS